MPFGLALKNGMTLQIDDGKQVLKAEFSTCLPQRLSAPISLDEANANAALSGKALNISAVAAAEGKPVTAKVFPQRICFCMARLVALVK